MVIQFTKLMVWNRFHVFALYHGIHLDHIYKLKASVEIVKSSLEKVEGSC